jgi:hypothetical protein
VKLNRGKLLEKAKKCLEEAGKFRRDFERDKRRGYTILSGYYTIMASIARIARHLDEFPSEVVELMREAEEWAEAADRSLRSGNQFQYSSGLDCAESAKSIVSLAEEWLQEA